MFSFAAVSFVEWEVDGLRNNGRRAQPQHSVHEKMIISFLSTPVRDEIILFTKNVIKTFK
jgi:hypothetical protein